MTPYLRGIPLCLVIWSTAEGLGGLYVAGSTDIGAAIIYVFVFILLFLTRSGLYPGVDRYLGLKLRDFSWLGSFGIDPQHFDGRSSHA